eukprot:CAMPEP_0176014912 /NCGR_PEP_ID=MMETSP0120_2-20121206/7066_1 /TAXON_ID=160619 /ORGANISM="Kryptoperidinium foliaceum, Strain CCMP 1326" /LENGTH=774 /DNA_ID=CAMNT_0017347865 /DNA_START=249 /DNA_END=2569 /DNA_ORIENTATION=+
MRAASLQERNIWQMSFLDAALTASASLLGLAFLSSRNGSEVRRTKSVISLSDVRSSFSDWSVWVGTVWILSRRQEKPHSSFWHSLGDFSFVGMLFLLRGHLPAGVVDKPKDRSKDSATTKADRGDESGIIQQNGDVNLGRTPKSDNRKTRGDRNVDISLARVLNVDGVSDVPAFLSTSSSAASLQQQVQESAQSTQQEQRYLELLVHNVSHTDLILSLEAPPSSETVDQSDYCLCRPRFSAFDTYSRRMLQVLNTCHESLPSKLISFPRYKRSGANGRVITSLEDPEAANQLPIGFNLSSETDPLLSVTGEELNDLRIRGRDALRLENMQGQTRLNALFFPLLATLLPQWQARVDEKYGHATNNRERQASAENGYSPRCKKVVILVSGVGSPRNWTHSMDGNSTEQCAKLMDLFIRTLYPDLVVVHVHSHTNIFRYDENISFVQNELLPCVQSYRDAHATNLPYPDEIPAEVRSSDSSTRADHIAFDPDWQKSMNVTLSFADGSPARNHAIQAALRSYRPTFFHCWQLKTFWHELKIVDSDIEVHSFEEMETLPPIDLTTIASNQKLHDQQPMALQVVEEMKAFKADMENILQYHEDQDHDLRTFWLRKTKKPVLAVLAVQLTKDGPVKLYRGTNMEVSMPTGSLCAERNVIGTALADNPSLKRHHLKIIAVLSVPSKKSDPVKGRPRSSSTASQSSVSANGPTRRNSIEGHDATSKSRPPRPASRSASGDWSTENAVPIPEPLEPPPVLTYQTPTSLPSPTLFGTGEGPPILS